jgi:hypothetical protein
MTTNRYARFHHQRYDRNAVGAGWWVCAAGFALAFVVAITWLLA